VSSTVAQVMRIAFTAASAISITVKTSNTLPSLPVCGLTSPEDAYRAWPYLV
jgi:hypothetical protein